MTTKKKKTAKKTAKKKPGAAVPRKMSLRDLLGELSTALTSELGSNERRRLTLTVADVQQKKTRMAKRRKAKRVGGRK
jgi:IMP dehydrogenase/GMP reductase